MSSASI